MEAENFDYIEAVKFLAERAKDTVAEGDSEEEKTIARKKQDLLKINIEAAPFL